MPARHLLQQGPVVRSLVRAGLSRPGAAPVATPGPVLHDHVAPRPQGLVNAYIRHCGGDPGWYKGTVPAHLFSQWGFPLMTRAMVGVPYDLRKGLNGGVRIEMHAPLPAGEPLQLAACLEDIDDNGSRAVIRTRLVTGTASVPEAVTAWTNVIVPLPRKEGSSSGRKKEKPTVPGDARELSRTKLTERHARAFAALTGDVNPIHWLAPYAKMAGFRNTILHGFATLGHSLEVLNRARFSGDPTRLSSVEIRFTRPVVLPARVGVFVREGEERAELYVGTAPGGPAFLTGTFEERKNG